MKAINAVKEVCKEYGVTYKDNGNSIEIEVPTYMPEEVLFILKKIGRGLDHSGEFDMGKKSGIWVMKEKVKFRDISVSNYINGDGIKVYNG